MIRHGVALLLLSFVAFMPQLLSDEWRGTEARRVEIAREMYETGDWMVPRLGQEPTLTKPPLYYWVLASFQHFGRDPFWMRLPSVLSFWLLALACYFPLRRHYSGRSAVIGAAGVLLSPMVLEHVPYAEIDPMFAALTAISIVWLAEGAAFGGRGRIFAAGVIGGLALMTKGPPYFLFLAGSILVWYRRRRLSGAMWFFPPLLALPAAYYVPLLLWHVPPDEMASVAGEESVGRVTLFTLANVLETPWYLLRAVAAVLPLGLWAFHEYRGDREMREATVLDHKQAFLRISAAAMVGAVLILLFFPGRAGRYLLPGVPCFLIALGPAVAAYTRFRTTPSLVLVPCVRALGLIACVGLLVTPWVPFPYHGRTPWLLLALALAPLVVRDRVRVVGYALLLPVIAAWTVLPDRTERKSVPPRSYAAVGEVLTREVDRLEADDLASWGYISSQFLLDGEVIPGDERGRSEPTAGWLMTEEPRAARGDASPSGYFDRVRVQLSDRVVVLKQRR